jgi:hypothetical protein
MPLGDRFIKALLQCIYCIIFSLTLTESCNQPMALSKLAREKPSPELTSKGKS